MTGNATTDSEILTDLHRTLTEATGTFTEKVEALLSVGQSYLEMDAGIVAAVDDDTYEVEIIESDHEQLSNVPAGMTISLSETVCERTLERGETYAVDSVPDDPTFATRAAVTEFGGERYIGTPLTVENQTYGTLCFYDTESRSETIDDHDQMIIEFIAQLVTYELEHHLQQAELRATKSELESLFDRVDDAFFSLNTDWEFSYLNDRAEGILGIAAEDVVGDTIWEVFPDAGDSIFEEKYSHAVERQETVSFEAPFDPLDAWFEVTAYPDEDGLSVYFRDITERKQRRTELERYEQILNTVSDGVYALDEDETFTYVNEGLATLTGYDREELIGSHIGLFKSESTIESARNAVTEAFHRVRNGEADGEVEIDLTVERADDTQIPCQDHIALLPFEEEFRGSVGTIRDMSEQVEREETLNGLVVMARELLLDETPTAVAETVVETVVDVLGFDRAVVRLYDEEHDELRPAAATETMTTECESLPPIAPGEGVVGEAFESGEIASCVAGDTETDTGAAPTLSAVPIGERGVLCIGVPEPKSCSTQTEQLIQLLATNAEAAFDRTDRQQTLRRYESIVETVREMLCVIDSEGQFKLLTEPLADTLGTSREQLLGKQAIEFIIPEDRDEVAATFDQLDDKEPITLETTITTTDGTQVPVSIEAAELPQAGSEGEVIISVHDRTELVSAKQAAAAERERFSYLFENLTDPIDEIELVDGEPQLRGVNSAFKTLFGEPVLDSVDTETVQPLAIESSRVVDTDAPTVVSEGDRELKLQTSEGMRYFLYRQVPYELNDSHRRFELYTDITALKRRETQLQVLHRVLRHNLRNDLNVVSGFAELLAGEVENDRHREFADRIVTNTAELLSLSETARTIEAVVGKQSVERGPVELGALLEPTVTEAAAAYPEATISLSQSEPVTIAAGSHLQTAVAELIENGIEHNESTEPTVAVSITTDSETATITVSDNGRGVPTDEWKIVTGESEISQLEHGSGLGLWLVRWVTEGYGGTLRRRGGDASVEMSFPVEDAA